MPLIKLMLVLAIQVALVSWIVLKTWRIHHYCKIVKNMFMRTNSWQSLVYIQEFWKSSYVNRFCKWLFFPIRKAVMEFELFCDKKIISTVITSLTFVSFFIGAGVAGQLADKFGRYVPVLSVILAWFTP